jgi:hypothetical protein
LRCASDFFAKNASNHEAAAPVIEVGDSRMALCDSASQITGAIRCLAARPDTIIEFAEYAVVATSPCPATTLRRFCARSSDGSNLPIDAASPAPIRSDRLGRNVEIIVGDPTLRRNAASALASGRITAATCASALGSRTPHMPGAFAKGR